LGSRQAHKVIDKAQPLLGRGERVEMVAFITIGSVNLRKEILRAVAVGTAAAIASGGMFLMMRRPRKAYLAYTSERLMFFDGETFFGMPGKLLFTLPRQAVHVAESGRFGLGLLRVDLAIEGQDKGLRVNFAPGARETGEDVVASLEAASRLRRQPVERDYRPRPDRQDYWPEPERTYGQQVGRRGEEGRTWDDRQPRRDWGDGGRQQTGHDPRQRQGHGSQWGQQGRDN
jgi:hypothetical protein